MNKKTLLVALAVVLLTGCGENSTAYKTLKQSYDSLMVENASLKDDQSELDSLVASILTNFAEISQVEGMIQVNPNMSGDNMRKSERERISSNVSLINEKIQQAKNSLDTLEQKLKDGNVQNKKLTNTVVALRKQLTAQTNRIKELEETLEKRNIAIVQLDNKVSAMTQEQEELQRQAAEQAAQLAQQEKALNTVHYCIGTSSDLKEMRIVRNGRVNTDDAEQGYFTKADKRNLTQIPLMSKKAKLLTVHPTGSYELVKAADGTLTLHIKNFKDFWSNSSILVVEVN